MFADGKACSLILYLTGLKSTEPQFAFEFPLLNVTIPFVTYNTRLLSCTCYNLRSDTTSACPA